MFQPLVRWDTKFDIDSSIFVKLNANGKKKHFKEMIYFLNSL